MKKISAIWGRKHCEKRRNCLLQAISPFLTMFSTAIYLKCVKELANDTFNPLPDDKF